ncbi:MAG: DUF5670 family protein [Gemmatimonadota bacterium]
MFLIVAVVLVGFWALGFLVLQVPNGPIHGLLVLAAAAVAGHFLNRRQRLRRALMPNRHSHDSEEDEDAGHSRLRLRTDGRGRSFIGS